MYIYLSDELSMYLSLRNIRKILIGGIAISSISLAFLYSDNIMVGFSDFSFLSGTTEINSLSIELTGGDTTGFSVIIYNKEYTGMTYRLWFVDAGLTNDSLAQKACFGQNETSAFWQYVTGDTSLFTLPAKSSITKILSVTFPQSYSWIYHWCIMFYPSSVGGSTMNTLPRRGGFIDALVHRTSLPVMVKAFPSNRVYQWTNNANTGILKIYDSNKQLISTSPLFTLNSAGTGEALIDAPDGTYYLVFKGQSHLASYLSGVIIWESPTYLFDFTTGNNLYGTQQLNSAQDDGNRYQSAGDLKNILGVYDYMVNGNDIAILTQNGLQEWWIDVLDPRNLNGDWAVNASDISVIWVNFELTDSFKDGFFTW